MHKIEKLPPARPHPHVCAITGRTSDEEGFLDTRRTLKGWDRHVFLSMTGLREAATHAGMVRREEVDKLEKRLFDLGVELKEATERLDDLEALHKLDRKVAEYVA